MEQPHHWLEKRVGELKTETRDLLVHLETKKHIALAKTKMRAYARFAVKTQSEDMLRDVTAALFADDDSEAGPETQMLLPMRSKSEAPAKAAKKTFAANTGSSPAELERAVSDKNLKPAASS